MSAPECRSLFRATDEVPAHLIFIMNCQNRLVERQMRILSKTAHHIPRSRRSKSLRRCTRHMSTRLIQCLRKRRYAHRLVYPDVVRELVPAKVVRLRAEVRIDMYRAVLRVAVASATACKLGTLITAYTPPMSSQLNSTIRACGGDEIRTVAAAPKGNSEG